MNGKHALLSLGLPALRSTPLAGKWEGVAPVRDSVALAGSDQSNLYVYTNQPAGTAQGFVACLFTSTSKHCKFNNRKNFTQGHLNFHVQNSKVLLNLEGRGGGGASPSIWNSESGSEPSCS